MQWQPYSLLYRATAVGWSSNERCSAACVSLHTSSRGAPQLAAHAAVLLWLLAVAPPASGFDALLPASA